MDLLVSDIIYLEDYKKYDTREECFKYWEGYEIHITTSEPICVLITNDTLCCESFGVALLKPSFDLNLDGCTIASIKCGKDLDKNLVTDDGHMSNITNNTHNEDKMDKTTQYAVIDVQTDKGLFQIVPYNCHNGYYSHEMYVKWPTGHEEYDTL
jgi:hypothetical protein